MSETETERDDLLSTALQVLRLVTLELAHCHNPCLCFLLCLCSPRALPHCSHAGLSLKTKMFLSAAESSSGAPSVLRVRCMPLSVALKGLPKPCLCPWSLPGPSTLLKQQQGPYWTRETLLLKQQKQHVLSWPWKSTHNPDQWLLRLPSGPQLTVYTGNNGVEGADLRLAHLLIPCPQHCCIFGLELLGSNGCRAALSLLTSRGVSVVQIGP